MAVQSLALVAHDHKKQELIAWAKKHTDLLKKYSIFSTGTTGKLIKESLGIDVNPLLSGPLGGDQQLGAKIAQNEVDLLIFFWDPLAPMPHDPDVKALLRLATLWNVPTACNEASADMMIASPLLTDPSWHRKVPDYSSYLQRKIT